MSERPAAEPGAAPGGAEPHPRARVAALLGRLAAGQVLKGRWRYRLEERIGSGSFGVVWRASCIDPPSGGHDSPPATVAIKFFLTPTETAESKLIKRELSALLSLRARTIPRVYDWLVKERFSFFVMDYFRHGSAAQTFKLAGALDDETAWRLLADLMRALQAAHREGVLHLDIKPSNIMLDGTGGYVLLDFGISQANQVAFGPARTVGAGSLGYQAPEQRRLDMHRLDTRTDLWAAGATVWALRSGIDLKQHVERVDTRATGSQTVLPPLSRVVADCAMRLEAVVMPLLRAEPRERPGGAAEVLAAMRAAAAGETAPADAMRAQHAPDPDELATVIEGLMDPVWSAVCQRGDLAGYFAKFAPGEFLCREDEASHHAFLLLRGRVRVERGSRILNVYDKEGVFLGELSTLTGTPRTASLRAEGEVWACVFNAAELERLLAFNPAVGIRLVKLLAERLIRADQFAG